MSALVLSSCGTVRGKKGGVFKVLAGLREQRERLDQSPVLQKLREVRPHLLILHNIVMYTTLLLLYWQ